MLLAYDLIRREDTRAAEKNKILQHYYHTDDIAQITANNIASKYVANEVFARVHAYL